MILYFVLGSALGYFIWSLACLEINMHRARSIGIPLVRVPIDPVRNVLWMIIQPHVWGVLDRLPIKWSSYPNFVRLLHRGWHFREKADTALQFGPVWAIVTPMSIYLHITDPQAINDVFSRRWDFQRPVHEYNTLNVYGLSISTAGTEDWARHRKAMAAPFNESIMKFVWDESIRQSEAMGLSWRTASMTVSEIPSVRKDIRTISLNVLSATGFRKSYPFKASHETTVHADDETGYRKTLSTVLDNAILIMLIPYRYLKGPLVPKKLVEVGDAARAFKTHLTAMLEKEVTASKEGKPVSGGIMSGFVHSLELHRKELITSPELKTSKDGKKGLTVDEILSNLFVINFAGHDTTANTLTYSLYLLSVYPEVQDWLAEEISAVTKGIPIEEWEYQELFPRLIRCRAILLETLRVYAPVMVMTKWTANNAQTLRVGDRVLQIPARTRTMMHLLAIQLHPQYWSDSYTWKPSRWITPEADSSGGPGQEVLSDPTPNTYFPWSDGPQNCPGKKFSEVESVAILACLFRKSRLLVRKTPGETEESAKKRTLACINHANHDLLLRMEDPDQVKLMLVEQ
ncbi:hypothetical protein KVR01_000661 [Diaporthe batatas]|uniref:uncharacterized protein n=1 Tax=Diaporthe batatas TaxID=748121 RepID=UPI001D043507|nr:uncharacterized protein KVR01_000661 [Diaporthe batatas]KAG8169916.1 hypothetical protein KVR01_000661 [Diaporthe batatas]